jgi:hypothetical protein
MLPRYVRWRQAVLCSLTYKKGRPSSKQRGGRVHRQERLDCILSIPALLRSTTPATNGLEAATEPSRLRLLCGAAPLLRAQPLDRLSHFRIAHGLSMAAR